jgi:hypothetical protein
MFQAILCRRWAAPTSLVLPPSSSLILHRSCPSTNLFVWERPWLDTGARQTVLGSIPTPTLLNSSQSSHRHQTTTGAVKWVIAKKPFKTGAGPDPGKTDAKICSKAANRTDARAEEEGPGLTEEADRAKKRTSIGGIALDRKPRGRDLRSDCPPMNSTNFSQLL